MSGGFIEPVVAPEQLVVGRDRRNAIHAELKGGIGGSPQRFHDLRVAHPVVESITGNAGLLTGARMFPAMLRSRRCWNALRNAWSVNSRPLPTVNAYIAARIAVR
jgi:hypothetical protein